MRPATLLVATALAVVTSVSCASGVSAPSQAPASGDALPSYGMPSSGAPPALAGGTTMPPLPSKTPPVGTLALGSSRHFAFEGDAHSDLFIFGDTIVWSSAPWVSDQPPLRPGAGRIQELSLTSGRVRVLYTAGSTSAGVSLKASADWLTWQESTDSFRLSDARLYAMSRRGGTPILIDDVRRYRFESFLTWSIDGADLYWTLPELQDEKLVSQLKHRRLPDGPTEVIVTAATGQTIAVPSAHQGVVAYEVRSERQDTRVSYRLNDGSIRDVGMAPASEPVVGEGFVAFKRANVAQVGALVALFTSGGRVVDLGIGEQPRGSGSWLAWGSWLPDPLDPTGSSPKFVAQPLLGCVARFKPALPNPGSSTTIPSIGGDWIAWRLTDLEKPQHDRETLVVAELRGMRCA
jgi:hypothetical protein